MSHFNCQDVMHFLGRRTSSRFNGEATATSSIESKGSRETLGGRELDQDVR
jgi:hypothetical protein